MSYADEILPEFDHEMANTRRVLELVPDDKLEWRAHPDLNTIGWNAQHLAQIPGWVEGTLTKPSWDIGLPEGEAPPALLTSRDEILKLFDANVATARQAFRNVKDDELDVPWSLLYNGQTLFTLPRRTVIRTYVLNHIVHHRAHLLVYLHLNNIAVPQMYWPSGDQ